MLKEVVLIEPKGFNELRYESERHINMGRPRQEDRMNSTPDGTGQRD
jgi:hypothetical protein